MANLVLVHFSPLEWYPPVQNFIGVIESSNYTDKIIVISTLGNKSITNFKSNDPRITILRFGNSGIGYPAWLRYFNYFYFYSFAAFSLIYYQPKKILYFESISSFPAYLYKKLINRKCQIFIHYHEYTSKQEYANGMMLVRWFHTLEKHLFAGAHWISHTNIHRLKMFENDLYPIEFKNLNIVPNYPPKKWARPLKEPSHPLRIVYIGALSIETMFVEEFTSWVSNNRGVCFDIYTYNLSKGTADFFSNSNFENITINNGVSYNEIPQILEKYDVGVILYKGHIPNYIYNAPNKLFEYFICGLDVWFPDLMVTAMDYVRTDSPKVVGLKFDRLHQYNPIELVKEKILSSASVQYVCEDALLPLTDKFFC